jgi:hypothetical protein
LFGKVSGLPAGSLSDYKAAAVWKDFFIEEEGNPTVSGNRRYSPTNNHKFICW